MILGIVALGGYFWISKKNSTQLVSDCTQQDVMLDQLTSDAQSELIHDDILLDDEIALQLFEDEDVTPAIVLNEGSITHEKEIDHDPEFQHEDADALLQPSLDFVEPEIAQSSFLGEIGCLERNEEQNFL